MTTATFNLEVNPFKDDIVREPRDVDFSVTGLNDAPLECLVAAFAALEIGELPRRPVKADKARLVISPDRGYGKSHLLGRLFHSLGSRATQVYLRPFQDPYKAWHSILLLTIQELERPVEATAASCSQLEALARGVWLHLAASLMASGEFRDYDHATAASSFLRELATDPTRLSEHQLWIEWFEPLFDQPHEMQKLASLLRGHGIDLFGRERAWLKILGAQAFSAGTARSEASLKWIRGEPLESEEVALLGISSADNEGRGEASAPEINDLSFKRLRGLCLLSSFYRPFLFCFDQTEFFASDPSLIDALGNCIDKLFVEVPNQMTVITANYANWQNDIVPHIDLPQRERIAPAITMDGIRVEGAAELIRDRLHQYRQSDETTDRFFADGWLEQVFKQLPELGVRAVLMRAADRFQSLAGTRVARQNQTLDDLFRIQINDVLSKKALVAYNQDALMWFTRDIADGQDNVSIARPANRKYFSVDWQWPDRLVCFAFEAGDNSQRWKGIANEAIKIADSRRQGITLSYVFRTPDLAKVPRKSWMAIGKTVEEAIAKGFHIYALSIEQVCELHAARELYSNALQGNIAFSGPQTLGWLQDHFKSFLKDLSSRSLRPETSRDETGEVPTGKPTDGLSDQLADQLDEARLRDVVETVRKLKLVDIEVVLSKLGSEALRDRLLRSVEAHPNLKAHPFPRTTFLQWRITP
jgi:hypothetical protein